MKEYIELEAVRLYIESEISLQNDVPEHGVSPSLPTDFSNLQILRESNRIHDYVTDLGLETRRIYENDIVTRQETVGRVIDPAMPVRFSGGIEEIASLLDSADGQLSQLERTIDQIESESTFNTDCSYDEPARIAITLDRKMIERAMLYLHSHLWMLWTLESLEQADQIYGLMQRQDRFSEVGEDAFAYLAHPPIIVSTLACTAMIEEVGAEYINQFISGKSMNPDETRASDVLDTLSNEYQNHTEFDISAINETIVSSRQDISHYLSKRPDAVTSENLEKHINQGMASIRLIDILTNELLTDVLQDYRNRVLHKIVNVQ